MKILAKYQDKEYPLTTITHTRKAVRAIVFNDEGKLALHHLFGDDRFGHRDYFETPGGGVKKYETLEKALRRELDEELGVSIKDITPLGRVVDFYNLIQQRCNTFYYLCYVDKKTKIHYDEAESHLIESTHWVSVDEAIKLYEAMDKAPLERLVKQRELPIVLLVKKILELK